MFCVGDDVNIEKANNSLISNDRSWKRNKFRLTYVAEAPELTQGIDTVLLGGPRPLREGWAGELPSRGCGDGGFITLVPLSE